MSVAIRAITRIQDADDINVSLGVGVDENILTYDHDTARFVLRAPVAAPDLSGYALLAGRAGGQTLYGGTAANDDITIHGTSNATRTTSYVLLQPTAGYVGIGTSAPQGTLHIKTALNDVVIEDISANLVGISANTSDGADNKAFYFQGGGKASSGLANRGSYVAMFGNEYTTYGGDVWVQPGNVAASKFRVHKGDGTLALAVNSVDGNVGIGTASPATALHVVGAATITGGIRPAANSTTALQLQNVAGTSILNVDTTNARVGIGTTAPVAKLHIITTEQTGAELRIENTHASGYSTFSFVQNGKEWQMAHNNSNDYFAFWEDGTDARLTLKEGGNVGLGTTSPTTRLDIDAGALTMKEMTAPTGVADKAMLYTKDNGAGKTQLCCKLGDNVEIVLATQA